MDLTFLKRLFYLPDNIELKSPEPCKYCTGVFYTSKPFHVRTQMGRDVEVIFNHCPYCGRNLKGDKK